jgi:hypothetical protein
MMLKIDPKLASFKMTVTVGQPRYRLRILPLHFHLSFAHSSIDVVQMLFDAYPRAILVSYSNGEDASTLIRGVIRKLDQASKWRKATIQKILDFVEK